MSWLPKKTVVAPYDFSDGSQSSVELARDEFVADPAALHVISVLPPLEPNDPGVVWNTVDDNSRRKHATEALKAKFADPKYAGVNFAIAFGHPGDQIAEYAEKVQADLIILPSHGRRGLSRILIGSVADRVVRLAHCPVLILKQ